MVEVGPREFWRAARRGLRVAALCAFALGLAASIPGAAAADMRVCNRTTYLLNVALGSAAGEAFKTEGWWSIAADTCQSVVRGTLQSRFLYLYAADIDGRSVVEGSVTMCVERRGFEIFDTSECWRRGYEAADFVEIDTLDFDSWTVFLEEGGRVRLGP
ncbi:MAG TPA: DUF1036 domain-containing protein [Methylomirabilota bacterium]|nr:DUF1036 domain-containing protein [Methylomirabilota bacterium]